MDGVYMTVAVGAVVCVAVGAGDEVGTMVCVAVAVGHAVSVNVGGTGVNDGVDVGKFGMIVTPGTGVLVGTLGTHSLCPV